MTRPHSGGDGVLQATIVASELIAKMPKPQSEGEFMTECLVASKMLAPDKVQQSQSVSLSGITRGDEGKPDV